MLDAAAIPTYSNNRPGRGRPSVGCIMPARFRHHRSRRRDRREARLDAFGLLASTRLREPDEVLLESVAGVVPTPFFDHGRERIHTRGRAFHAGGLPVEEESRGTRDDVGVQVGHVELFVRVALDVEQHHRRESVERVVVGADAQPLVEPDGALRRPCGARQHEMVAPRAVGGRAVERRGEAPSVPSGRNRAAQQVDDRGREINLVVQRGVGASASSPGHRTIAGTRCVCRSAV